MEQEETATAMEYEKEQLLQEVEELVGLLPICLSHPNFARWGMRKIIEIIKKTNKDLSNISNTMAEKGD